MEDSRISSRNAPALELLRFVIPAQSTKETVSENMKMAFNMCREKKLGIAWERSSAVLARKQKSQDIFVCDPFETDEFNHLSKLQCRLYGPLVITMSLAANKSLPRRPNVLYTLTMRGITATFSSFPSSKRKSLLDKFCKMGGTHSPELTKSVTHLITLTHKSQKYEVAANSKIPVMTPDWIEECWKNKDLPNPKLANHQSYAKNALKPFHNLHICISQLKSEERKKLSALIQMNGGVYSGHMNLTLTTHLILDVPTGNKFFHAQSRNIICLKKEWITESAESGYYKPTFLYEFEKQAGTTRTSSPLRDDGLISETILSVSSISKTSDFTKTSFDNTVLSNVSFDINQTSEKPHFQKPAPPTSLKELDNLNLEDYLNMGFLDGLKIFVSGLSGSQLEKLYKIINMGGATRLSKLSSTATHIVVKDEGDLAELNLDISFSGLIVNVNWLVDSLKTDAPANEKDYEVGYKNQFRTSFAGNGNEMNDQTMLEDLTKNGNEILVDKETLQKDQTNSSNSKENHHSKSSSQIGQPNFKDDQSGKHSDENQVPSKRKASTLVEDSTVNDQRSSEATLKADDEENLEMKLIFLGLSFRVKGTLNNNELCENIEDQGGRVVHSDEGMVDYLVVPFLIEDENFVVPDSGKNLVTDIWTLISLDVGNLLELDSNPLFRPIRLHQSVKSNPPLKDCVVTMSQIPSIERESLEFLAEKLGAVCQQYFARNPKCKFLASTHLILTLATGQKYTAAKNWGLPAVNKNWLFETAASGKRADENLFLVLEPVTPNEDTLTNSAPANLKTPLTRNKQFFEENDIDLTTPVRKPRNGPRGDSLALDPTEVIELGPPPKKRKVPSDSFFESIFKDLQPSKPKEDSFTEILIKSCLPLTVPRKVLLCDGPLLGVTVLVSKKLKDETKTLHETVLSMGGDYTWVMDTHNVTHLIFRGKDKNSMPELKWARNNKKKIVSPEWVLECKKLNKLVKEELFPYVYNPRLSISSQMDVSITRISPEKRPTPPHNQQENSNSPKTTPQKMNLLILKQDSPTLKKKGCQEIPTNIAINEVNEKRKQDVEDLTSLVRSAKSERKRLASVPVANTNLGPKILSEEIESSQVPSPVTSQVPESIPIIWENHSWEHDPKPVEEKQNATLETSKKLFTLTGASETQKLEYSSKIESLEGTYLSTSSQETPPSHVIMFKVVKSEKLLTAIARGSWILDKSYIEHSFVAGKFLDEESYEFGNPNFVNCTVDVAKKDAEGLAVCPYRWRLSQTKAFSNWEVILRYCPLKRINTYQKILEAGGARIVNSLDEFKGATSWFAFYDVQSLPAVRSDLESLQASGVSCLQADYFPAYLIEEEPCMEKYLLKKV